MAQVNLTFSDPNIDEVEIQVYRGNPMLDDAQLAGAPVAVLGHDVLTYSDTIPVELDGNVVAYAVGHKRGSEPVVIGPIILATTVPNTLLVVDASGNYGTDESGNFITTEIA